MEFKNAISFTTAIPFDVPITTMTTSLTGSVTLTKNIVNAYAGCGTILRVIANGSGTVNIGAFKKTTTSGNFVSTSGIINVFCFFFDGTDFWVTIFQEAGALVQLSTPASFAAGTPGATSIPYTWADVANESSYVLELSASSIFSTIAFTYTPAANATSYTATGLSNSTLYYARLRAIGDGATYSNSNNTATVSATTTAGAVLEALNFTTVVNGLTESPSGTWSSATAACYGLASKHLAGDGYYQYKIDNQAAALGDAVVIGLGLANTNVYYSNGVAAPSTGYNYDYGLYQFSGTAYVFYPANGSPVSVGAVSDLDLLRLRRAGSTVYAEKSSDSGTTWTLLYTFAAATSANLYIKTSIVTSGHKLVQPKGYNVI